MSGRARSKDGMTQSGPSPSAASHFVHVYPTWGPEHSLEAFQCWCRPEWLQPSTIVHRTPEEAAQ